MLCDVSLNPVRARLVQQAQDWQWSSVAAHLALKDDKLVKVAPVLSVMEILTNFSIKLQVIHLYSSLFANLKQRVVH